jgi:monofunctional biosynthetic peptidoglycan transglycosylase
MSDEPDTGELRPEEAPAEDGTAPEPPAEEESPDETGSEIARPPWLRALAWGALAVLLVLVAWLAWTWARWPDVSALRDRNPPTTAFIEMYRAAEREAGRTGEVRWSPVPYDRISANLKRAVVASEDTEFFFHDGFSSHEMQEAIRKAIREREAPRGASTITQQLAKNLWLSPSRSLTRKFREALLTRQLEGKLSKERILELYLNVVELGPGVYGAEAAAQHYFGIPAAALSPRQGAMLAAALPRPRSWNPTSESEYYARRVERILEIEQQLEYLDRYFGPATPGRVDVAPPEVGLEDPAPDPGEPDSAAIRPTCSYAHSGSESVNTATSASDGKGGSSRYAKDFTFGPQARSRAQSARVTNRYTESSRSPRDRECLSEADRSALRARIGPRPRLQAEPLGGTQDFAATARRGSRLAQGAEPVPFDARRAKVFLAARGHIHRVVGRRERHDRIGRLAHLGRLVLVGRGVPAHPTVRLAIPHHDLSALAGRQDLRHLVRVRLDPRDAVRATPPGGRLHHRLARRTVARKARARAGRERDQQG